MIKTHKISSWSFMLLIICSCIVFGLFFFVGYDNPMGKLNAPIHTDSLIYLMYVMTALCMVATVGAALKSAIGLIGGPKGDNKTGVPNTAISIVSILIMVGSLVVGYAMSSTKGLAMPNGSVYDDTFFLVLTDTFIYSIYGLVVITVIGLIVNLSGIFKR